MDMRLVDFTSQHSQKAGKASFTLAALCLCLLTPVPMRATTSVATSTVLSVSASSSSVTSVSAGSIVTLTAAVTESGNAVTAGQVKFCDAEATYCTDIHLLGVAQLNSTGTASISYRPGVGSHEYKAVYVGATTSSAAYKTSTSSAESLTVTGTFATTTSLSASGTTLTATVSASASFDPSPLPTGTVDFIDTTNSNAVLGTASLTNEKATVGVNSTYIAVATSGLSPEATAVGDVNGDGIPDMVVTDLTANTVTIYIGTGTGTFTKYATYSSYGVCPYSVVLGDFNNDGKLDFAVANGYSASTSSSTGDLVVFIGNGDGTFTYSNSITVTRLAYSLAIADFNGDGNLDLVVGFGQSTTISILLGNGDGTFTASSTSPITVANVSGQVGRVDVGDFNNDGYQDIAVSVAGVESTSTANGYIEMTLPAQNVSHSKLL